MTQDVRTFRDLMPGTVLNFCRAVTGEDTYWMVVGHYQTNWGWLTKMQNNKTFHTEPFNSETKVQGFWSVYREAEERYN